MTISPFILTFEAATVSTCNYLGQTVSGIRAVVRRDGEVVFKSKAHTKRSLPRADAMRFIESAI